MPKELTSAGTNPFFIALKALAVIAQVAMAASVFYAAATALRYWPHINV